MKVQPVKRYGGAAYPDKPSAAKQPGLLAHTPERWQSKPVVLAALTSLVGMTAAYQTQVAGGKAKAGSLVAPLFIHGEGRGTFGCEVVNPPVFLSEAEAREVVIEEAKRAGIQFKAGGPALAGVEVPARTSKDPKGTTVLTADGFDAKRGVAFVVVSGKDAEDWTEPSGSSIDRYDSKKLAGEVVAKVKKSAAKGVTATFYEPYSHPNPDRRDWEKSRADALVKDREELRKQVRDFVKWLKSQGVI
jgi:hypothetical protein